LFVLDNCGNRPLTELRKKDFRNLSLWLSDTLGVSNARTNRLMSCCRSMLTYVEEDDDYDYDNNLAAKVKGLPKEHVRDIVFLDDRVILELVDKLMEKKDYKKATLVALLYDCGSRKNEIAQVEKESFYDESKNLTNKLIGKRGKIYRAVYHSLTKKCVKKYLEERGEDDVKELFITEGGFPARAEVLYDWIISLRPIVEEITGKPSNLNVHTFRHSFIQNLSDGTHYLCRE
jgi:site-specific recombinase XerD